MYRCCLFLLIYNLLKNLQSLYGPFSACLHICVVIVIVISYKPLEYSNILSTLYILNYWILKHSSKVHTIFIPILQMEKLMAGRLNNLPKLPQLESSSTEISTQVFWFQGKPSWPSHYSLSLWFTKGIILDAIYFIFISNYALDFLVMSVHKGLPHFF